jgi:hypothetical protein
MSTSPFRTRVMRSEEIRLLVRRTTDAPGAMASDAPALTEEEVARHLGALGFSEDALRASFASPAPESPSTSRTVAPPIDGHRMRFDGHVDLPGMVPARAHANLAEALSAIMDEPGSTRAIGRKLTWRPSRAGTDVEVTVHSRGARTAVGITASVGHRPLLVGALVGLLGTMAAAFVPGPFGSGAGLISAALLGVLVHRHMSAHVEHRLALLAWCLDRVAEAAQTAIAGHRYRLRIADDARDRSREPLHEPADVEPGDPLPVHRRARASR